ncbi:MAG: wax ester/triacylglycerol synthase family O-acyltransferase [Actinomycetota bacterium]
MKQLTGLDVGFLLMETPNTYGHVNGLSIYERPDGDFDPFSVVRERFEILASQLEPLRRRVVEVPLELDRPYWIEDKNFDIDFHVRHIGIAPPGAADQLAEQVARIVGRHMDRRRPLWEVYVMEGLADGRWAMLTKLHHATIDGASGVIMLKMITGSSPDEPWDHEYIPWEGEDPPTRGEMLQRAAKNIALNPVRGARISLSMMRDVASALGIDSVSGVVDRARDTVGAIAKRSTGATDDSTSRVSIPITPAPPTPWNASVTPHRRFAMRSMQLSNLKALKDATGGTLNDVVMAVCTGALRNYLIEHDALPEGRLRAMVPVSIRTGDEEDPWTNRVSAIVADLPTDVEDPLERITECREAMLAGKRQFDLLPAEQMVDATQYTSPVIAASAVRLVSRLKLADRVNSPVNVVISNVPGPREPLYFAGAKLDHYIPVSTISDGVGLNITVHSYEDRMDFGLIADRELVPDLWHLVDLHIDEIHTMFEVSGAEWAEPPSPPAMRYGGDGVDPIPPTDPELTARLAGMTTAPVESSSSSTNGNGSGAGTGRPSAKKRSSSKGSGSTASKSTGSGSKASKKSGKKKTAARAGASATS